MSGRAPLSLRQNRWIRILFVAFVMHIISFIDRSNISMAIPAMMAELHITAAAMGFATGALFFTLLAVQVPAGRLASTWSPRKLIFYMSAAWGVVSMSTALVHDETDLLLNRLAMGLVEGGELTVAMVLIRHWFTRPERARATMLLMISLPLSSVIANPVSGLLLAHVGWQAMFVLEGLPALIWAVVWYVSVADRPEEASWLPPDTRAELTAALAREDSAIPTPSGHWIRVAWHPFVLLLSGYNLLALIGNWGVIVWLPTLLKDTGVSITTVGYLTSLTYAAGAVMMVVVSFSSDRFLERKWHMIIPTILCGVALLATPVSSRANLAAIVFCFVMANGFFYGRFGPFWAFPAEVIPKRDVGVAIGMVAGIGNLGGFFGPYLFGYVRSATGNFSMAVVVAGVLFILAGVMAAFIPTARPSAAPVQAE